MSEPSSGREPDLLERVARPGSLGSRLLLDRERLALWAGGVAVVALIGWWALTPSESVDELPMTSTSTGQVGAADRAEPADEPSGSDTADSTARDDAAGSPGDSSTPDDTRPAGAPGETDSAASPVYVHVVGAVRRAGLVELPVDSRVADAIDAAGGLSDAADLTRLNLARRVIDGERLAVLAVGEPDPPGGWDQPPTPMIVPEAGAPATGGGASGPIDLNSADEAALDSLPGIGPATASAIVEFRSQNGPFLTVDDLLDVPGIGPAKRAQLDGLVTVSGP